MLTVYRVVADIEEYQWFFTDDLEFQEHVYGQSFLWQAIRSEWNPPELYIARPNRKEGQFFGFIGLRAFAVATDTISAYRKLRTFFDQSGELLPFVHKGREFAAFNCTNCLNALDEEKSGCSPTDAFIKHYVFIPARFHFSLFTVPKPRELFCVEGMVARHDEFKGYVEEQKLTGLMFEKLWSEEEEPKKGRKKK